MSLYLIAFNGYFFSPEFIQLFFETIKTVSMQHSAKLMQLSIQPVIQNLLEDAAGMNFLQQMTTEQKTQKIPAGFV